LTLSAGQGYINPLKLVNDPDQPDGQLDLTANAFHQLGQYTSNPVITAY